MHTTSRRFLDSQTELLDSYLAELAHLPSSDVVNFNNTAQFDALLRAAELSLLAPSFCQVPSVYVLHVMVTLAARCPESNWSHDPALGSVGGSTEYMRRVNADYDRAVANSALSQRSSAVLHSYVALASRRPLSPASQMLHDNLDSVFSSLVALPAKTPRRKRNDANVDDKTDANPASALDSLCAVEVISDSEDSDSPLEIPSQLPSGQESRSVISLSELGATNTSGLGEVATLFKDMPHLSAQATPEPEPPAKKRKTDALWSRIRVYDDDVLAARFGADYTFWDMVRWMCWCAESSSQYQKFLFNSEHTCVHSCYSCYASLAQLVLAFGAAQSCVSQTGIVARLGRASHEHTVETLLSGLGTVFRNKPFPCYNRELILLAHDPAVRVSQCKRTLEYDDNMDSMKLRVFALTLLSYHEKYSEKKSDIRSLLSKKSDHVFSFTAERVSHISVQYTRAFFGASRASLPQKLQDYSEIFLANVAMAVLGKVTGVEVCTYDTLEGSFPGDVLAIISGDRLYRGITEDLGMPSLEEFFERWAKMVFLAEWVTWRAACRSDQDVTAAAQAADETSHKCVEEFLESRSEDADLIEDSQFSVSRQEMAAVLERARCRFAAVAKAQRAWIQ